MLLEKDFVFGVQRGVNLIQYRTDGDCLYHAKH